MNRHTVFNHLKLQGTTLREKILKSILKTCPEGDLKSHENNQYRLSCVFIFFQRYHLMDNILHCLNSQSLKKDKFQIVLVEDKCGSIEGASLKQKFPGLKIDYFAPDHGWGKMGFMRNYGLSKAKGEIILFLDDDTVLMDTDFLKNLIDFFAADPSLDAVIPEGFASHALIKGQYEYHDPFFFTNRCMAYRKNCLLELKGFDSNFIGQEDVEFAIRFTAKNYNVLKTPSLQYYHPPLVYEDTSKGHAVGASFARSKYNMIIKCFLFINGIRWLPLYFLPGLKNKFMARFALGFLKGFVGKIFKKHKKVDYR